VLSRELQHAVVNREKTAYNCLRVRQMCMGFRNAMQCNAIQDNTIFVYWGLTERKLYSDNQKMN